MRLLITSLAAAFAVHADEPLSLAGEWRFALDPGDHGLRDSPQNWKFPDTIQLPGILTAQGFGDKPTIETEWTGKGWEPRHLFREWQSDENFKMPFFLTPPRHYLGPAWYQRELDIPEAWEGKRVRLFLERVHWESIVWIDGERVGRGDSLGTPHLFDLGPLEPGPHTITLRIDNRLDEVNPGPLAHSVTDHTQGNWNGAVGRIELQPLPSSHIDQVTVTATLDGEVRVEVRGEVAPEVREAGLRLEIHPVDDPGRTTFLQSGVVPRDAAGRFEVTRVAQVAGPRPWSEFDPALYHVRAFLSTGDDMPADRSTTTFGFREIENRGGTLMINGRRAFMRGTLECAIFPRLGHPPTDVASWKRIIRICKEHGLNHMRFHSWCPPEAAFIAADELGFYLQPEASAWANGSAQVGSGRPVDAWINAETDRILATYGNHPSFAFMAYGNEPGGPKHKEWLADWVKRQRDKDPRRLYTTGAGWPVIEGSDYHLPMNPRIQGWGQGLRSIINARPPSTQFDWRDYTSKHRDAPVISHEIGQWCVYPNFREIEKYTGYFKALNFEIFRETARRNGILDQSEDFLMASGKWQAAAYKHDIEAALRTPGFGGFQLLDLHDFPGQGTALVGVLDAFWDEKGYITPEEFRRFSGPVVPLARMRKMVLTRNESLQASLELAHFGDGDFKSFEPAWSLSHGDQILAAGTLDPRPLAAGNVHSLGNLELSLSRFPAPSKLTFTLGGKGTGISNSWDVFLYEPRAPEVPEVTTTRTLEETRAALAEGQAVLWLADPAQVADDPAFPLQIGFSPIFWNTAYTDWQPPHTLGLLNRADHPALAAFPTDTHSNWQWWEIVSRSRPFILTPHHELKPIVQPIDDWVTNRKLALVFEAKVGEGRLLACSADLESDANQRPAARQLLASLRKYAASPAFQPATELRPADLDRIMKTPPRVVTLGATISASSEAAGYEAGLAIDGDPKTFWHTEFNDNKTPLPHDLVLRFPQAVSCEGLSLTSRPDGSRNGRVKEVVVLGPDSEEIARAAFPDSPQPQQLWFPEPVKAGELTIRIVGSHTPPFASLAEIDLIP